MKKHLLGLAIFSFIVVSFAVAFGFFYAKKIQIVEEIRKPVVENNTRYRCNKKTKINEFEVISTQFHFDEKKLVSKIRMKLDGFADVPKTVKISTDLFTEQELKVKKFEIKDENFENFEIRKDTNEAIFDVISDLSKSRELNKKENLYVKFNIYTNYPNKLEMKSFLTEAQSVLFVHGKDSIIKK